MKGSGGDREGVGAEGIPAILEQREEGVEAPDSAEATRVAEDEGRAVVEVPLEVGVGVAPQRLPRGGLSVGVKGGGVELEGAGHAQVDAQRGALVLGEQGELLAVAGDVVDAVTGEEGVGRGDGASFISNDVGAVDLDSLNVAAEDALGEGASDGLDLGELGHLEL